MTRRAIDAAVVLVLAGVPTATRAQAALPTRGVCYEYNIGQSAEARAPQGALLHLRLDRADRLFAPPARGTPVALTAFFKGRTGVLLLQAACRSNTRSFTCEVVANGRGAFLLSPVTAGYQFVTLSENIFFDGESFGEGVIPRHPASGVHPIGLRRSSDESCL